MSKGTPYLKITSLHKKMSHRKFASISDNMTASVDMKEKQVLTKY